MKTLRVLTCIIGCLLGVAAQANNHFVQSASELQGCWERMLFPENVMKRLNEVEPWPARYQWFCFEANGRMSMYASHQPLRLSASQLRERMHGTTSTQSYQVMRHGFVQTLEAQHARSTRWLAGFTAIGTSLYGTSIGKGTLVMSVFDPEKRREVYWRYLRRVP